MFLLVQQKKIIKTDRINENIKDQNVAPSLKGQAHSVPTLIKFILE